MKRLFVIFFVVTGLSACAQTITTSLTYSVRTPLVKSKRPPVLILLHGYGSSESDLFSFGSRLDSRFLTFSLRGPLPQGQGYCWFPIQFRQKGELGYDYNAAATSRDKILSFISNACLAYGADSTQVFVLGFSQGAIMAYELACYAPGRIKGVVALSGRMMTETCSSKRDPLIKKVRFFIAHGTDDGVVNYNGSRSADSLLRAMKVPSVTFRSYKMGHTIVPDELEDLRAWLHANVPAN
jgi:phospholipase/carboxylesterase